MPWYLKQLNSQQLTDENIKKLCFTKGGVLTTEFERIFSDLFGENKKNSVYTPNLNSLSHSNNKILTKKAMKTLENIYKSIILELADGMNTLSELRDILGYEHGGFLGNHVKNLCVAGFITKHNI